MYAVGELKAKVLDNGSVEAKLHSVRTVEGIRPKIGKDVFSAIPEEIEKLNKRKAKDVINTPVRLGAGVALIIDSSCLRWLSPELMQKLHEKVGYWRDKGLLGNFRSIRAGGT